MSRHPWHVTDARGERVAGPFRSFEQAASWRRTVDQHAWPVSTSTVARPFHVEAVPAPVLEPAG